MTYYNDYETQPIGGMNPYHMCSCCRISVPQINGVLENHAYWCDYRREKEHELYIVELKRLADIGKAFEYFMTNPDVEEYVVFSIGKREYDTIEDVMSQYDTYKESF